MHAFPEADWKVLRGLKDVALERFCQRVLEEAAPLVNGSAEGGSSHHRYLALFKLIDQRDDELGDTFNNLRRSTALTQLSLMCYHRLVTDEELAHFSPQTRQAVEMYLKMWNGQSAATS